MKLSVIGAATFVALGACRVDAQGMNDLRAGVDARPVRSAAAIRIDSSLAARETGVSRRSLAIGAGVGAVVGAVVGGVAVSNTDLSRNEARGLFYLIGAGVGGLIGAGLGMAVVAFALP
jgi:hypothetical protein